jgi:DNA modification methylase
MTELAIGDRKNNAEAILDAHELGYINGDVLDMTYGLGRFWRLYRPDTLVTNDLDESTEATWNLDFTQLPDSWEGIYDSVVFDPPYKLNGTGGSHPSDDGYGVANKGSGRMDLIFAGLDEAVRVCAPNGHILVKCQDQVCSGRKVWQTLAITNYVCFKHYYQPKVDLVDQLHVRSYRPQPAGRRQVHARQDYSTLLVFRKSGTSLVFRKGRS